MSIPRRHPSDSHNYVGVIGVDSDCEFPQATVGSMMDRVISDVTSGASRRLEEHLPRTYAFMEVDADVGQLQLDLNRDFRSIMT